MVFPLVQGMTIVKNRSARTLSRTQLVWVAFFVLIPSALFILTLINPKNSDSRVINALVAIGERPVEDPVFSQVESLNDWSTIVIQHLGQPSGVISRIERDHKMKGLNGIGYHFVIGNGNGLGDGVIHVGYRWIDQLPAARPTESLLWEASTISICLVGNGDRRPFSDMQIRHLARLVQRLQQELAIPSERVLLASEITNSSVSPGQYFAEAQFRGQLLDIPSNK